MVGFEVGIIFVGALFDDNFFFYMFAHLALKRKRIKR